MDEVIFVLDVEDSDQEREQNTSQKTQLLTFVFEKGVIFEGFAVCLGLLGKGILF